MALYIEPEETKGNSDFPKISPPSKGTKQAVCYAVWDIGNQKMEWQGKISFRKKIVIAFEVNERITEEGKFKGKRKTISQTLTLSFYKDAALPEFMTAWLGDEAPTEKNAKTFDWESIIGKNCFLSIKHETKADKTYANIASIAGLPEGMPLISPEINNEPPKWVVEKQILGGVSIIDQRLNDVGMVIEDGSDLPF